MSDAATIIWCPYPDPDTARRAAEVLLREKLIACANIIPGVQSIFEFEGTVSSAEEVIVVFKTTAQQQQNAIARLGELHPYDTPAIVGSDCTAAHPATLNWLIETTGTS